MAVTTSAITTIVSADATSWSINNTMRIKSDLNLTRKKSLKFFYNNHNLSCAKVIKCNSG